MLWWVVSELEMASPQLAITHISRTGVSALPNASATGLCASHDGVWGWQPCLLTGIAVTAPVSRHCCGVTTAALAGGCSPLTVITVRCSGRRHQPSAWQRRGKQDSVWPYKELLRRMLLIGWQSVLSRRTAFSASPQPAILTLFSTSNYTRRVLVTWDWNKERCLDWSVDLFAMSILHFIGSINDWVTICIISSQKNC